MQRADRRSPLMRIATGQPLSSLMLGCLARPYERNIFCDEGNHQRVETFELRHHRRSRTPPPRKSVVNSYEAFALLPGAEASSVSGQ